MTFSHRFTKPSTAGSPRAIIAVLALVLAPSAALRAQTQPPLQAAPRDPAPGATAANPAAGGAQPTAASPGASMDSPLDQNSSTYIIGTGDVLQVTVWKEPGLSAAGLPVRPDGMISLPLVGDVQAASLTPMTLSLSLQERFKRYVQAPLVTVTISSIRPKEVYLVGEVAHVGPVTLTGQMTPLQAIVSAGGVSGFAKTKAIYILRKMPNGKQQKIPFNYKLALKTGDMQNVSLVAGDTIVVP